MMRNKQKAILGLLASYCLVSALIFMWVDDKLWKQSIAALKEGTPAPEIAIDAGLLLISLFGLIMVMQGKTTYPANTRAVGMLSIL